MNTVYEFRPLKKQDLDLIEQWHKKPHVKEFWDTGETWEESYEKYVFTTSQYTVKQFLVYLKEKPIGYI